MLLLFIQKLYQLGARKIVVNNIFPIGCEPHINFTLTRGANERASFFNQRLSNLIKDLQSTLIGSKIILVNLHKIFEDVFESPASYSE